MHHQVTTRAGDLTIGLPVYGADGKPWGKVAAVTSRYVTIAQGARGTETFDLPIACIAHAAIDRVDLVMPVIDPK